MTAREVLVLGGTAWLGQEVVRHLLAAGDRVTCLARGSSAPPPGARLVGADRRAAGAYTGVGDQEWDEVVEISYDPVLVSGALAALAGHARHWTLVSSISVYADSTEPGADETAALLEPVDLQKYGQAKVAAERASTEALGSRLLVVRPGLLAGPGDGSDRFGYWVSRFALAEDGPVLVPAGADRAVQVLDIQDLAVWMVDAGRGGLTGTFNATGDSHALAEVLGLAAGVAGFRGRTVEAPDTWLLENDVRYWAGPRSLPLWLPSSDAGFARRDTGAFRRAGGAPADLRTTLARALVDERSRGLARPRRSGLTRHEELELLARLGPPSA